MNEVYIYAADVWCEDCIKVVKEQLRAEGAEPEQPDEETTYDSDDWPKGPYTDQEADTPQHCSGCQRYLDQPLTRDGVKYVLEHVQEYLLGSGRGGGVLDSWVSILADYSLDGEDSQLLDFYTRRREMEYRAKQSEELLESLLPRVRDMRRQLQEMEDAVEQCIINRTCDTRAGTVSPEEFAAAEDLGFIDVGESGSCGAEPGAARGRDPLDGAQPD